MKFLLMIIPCLLFAEGLNERLLRMSDEEKVGALFVIPAQPKREEAHWKDVEEVIKKFHIGAIIVKQATPPQQVTMINWMNEIADSGLLIMQDAEWGLGMRMDEAFSFPQNGILGKLIDDEILFEIGEEIGREMRAIGAHVNLAPVVDVNLNPSNPIIGMRSFGSDPVDVGRKGSLMVRGLQHAGIKATAKHFPGHGDVAVDSHLFLPVLTKSKEELLKNDLLPFQKVIDDGVAFVMSGHLVADSLTEEKGLPCPFSKKAMTDLLRGEMGFKGFIITDALEMRALSDRYTPEEIALQALSAGHDFLLYADHIAPKVDYILQEVIPRAYAAILQEVKSGHLNIDDKVLRILALKEELGLLLPNQEPIKYHPLDFTPAQNLTNQLTFK